MALIKGALGKEKRHYHSHGDTLGRCPHCYNNNVEKIGVLTIEAVPHDVLKCRQCNTLHSGADGGIQSLVEEAKETYKTENIGFTAHVSEGTAVNTSYNNTQDDYETQRKFDDMNTKLQNMTNAMQNLTYTIENMARQNHDLMEKLMTDPLNGMRKAVSDFNLE